MLRCEGWNESLSLLFCRKCLNIDVMPNKTYKYVDFIDTAHKWVLENPKNIAGLHDNNREMDVLINNQQCQAD